MIWNSAQDVIYNGLTVYGVYANGVKVWPPAPQTFDIECYGIAGASNSAVALGMTATMYDEVLYAQAPTVGSFTATGLPAGSRIQCVMITTTGHTASAHLTGLIISSRTRTTGSQSASSYFTYNSLANNAKISAGNYGLFAFTASGEFVPMGSTYPSSQAYAPAFMTYCPNLPGQLASAQVSAQRTMAYCKGSESPTTTSVKYFNSSLTYSAVSTQASLSSTIWKRDTTTNSVKLSADICLGTTVTQTTSMLSNSQTGLLTASNSASKTFAGTSFHPTTTASGGSNLYTRRNVSWQYQEDTAYVNGSLTATWTATGIIA